MGYYTNYDLEFERLEGTVDLNEVQHYVDEDSCTEYDEPIGSLLEDSIKWYEHEQDMSNFSERFPGVLFTLSGIGEEGGDLWKKYFFNGESQRVQGIVTYEPFNRGKTRCK